MIWLVKCCHLLTYRWQPILTTVGWAMYVYKITVCLAVFTPATKNMNNIEPTIPQIGAFWKEIFERQCHQTPVKAKFHLIKRKCAVPGSTVHKEMAVESTFS